MVKLLKARWWKYLSIPILLYVLIFGLLQPLSPGIKDVIPEKVRSGERNSISVISYNTHLPEAGNSTQVWLKNGDEFYCANIVQQDEKLIDIEVDIPAKEFQRRFFDLVMNNDVDGTFELRDAFVLEESDSRDINSVSDCKVEVRNNEASFFNFPNREILEESIRNLFFHVCMWFAMVFLLLFSVISSILFLSGQKLFYDRIAHQLVIVGLLFGFLGILTGMFWAQFTWGHPWPNDPKLNGVLVAMLAYFAYIILRNSVKDENKRGRLAAVYNIFAFILYIIFIYVYPKFSASLHPGMGGNPAFSEYDLDDSLRLVFYPAVIGWTLIGFWIFSITYRITAMEEKISDL